MTLRFTEDELQQVREAVRAAEGHTSGEIVPYVVVASDTYEVAVWRGASLLAVLALGIAVAFLQFYEGWGMGWLYTGWGMVLLALAAGTLGALITAFTPSVKRLLAGTERLANTVHQQAMQAFVEEEVFNTRDRTGILLFVSLFEHRIEVLGDAGINEHVTPDEWTDIVLRIREGIRQGKLIEGLVEAIAMCGALLKMRGVEIQPDDKDELSNELRLRNRP